MEATASILICGGGALFLIAFYAFYAAVQAQRGELSGGWGLILAGILACVIGFVFVGGLIALIGGILLLVAGGLAVAA